MKTAVSGLVVLVSLLCCRPASAGQVIRAVSGTRDVVTIVDHGHTRGRPAVRVGSVRAPKRWVAGTATAQSGEVVVDGANGDRVALGAGGSSFDLNVMATEAVTSALKYRLQASDDADMSDIGADPTARELRLLGAVPDEAARDAVAALAMRLAGTDAVNNEVRVLSDWVPIAYCVFDDEHVKGRVESALLSWPELHAADIDVSVDQGITTLTGNVATQDQRVLASTAAISAAGVYLVQNRLSILPQ